MDERLNGFEKELEKLINIHSIDNEFNTPDFILASYICKCLFQLDEIFLQREEWFGNFKNNIEINGILKEKK